MIKFPSNPFRLWNTTMRSRCLSFTFVRLFMAWINCSMHVSSLNACDTFCGSLSVAYRIKSARRTSLLSSSCSIKRSISPNTKKVWWFLLITVWFFVFGHLDTLNVAFMVVNLHKFFAVKARIVVTNVWLVRINVILFAANKTFSVLLTETHFLFAFLYFVIRIAVLTVDISLAIFAVNGTFLARLKIWATTLLGRCSLTAWTVTSHTGMICCVFCTPCNSQDKSGIGLRTQWYFLIQWSEPHVLASKWLYRSHSHCLERWYSKRYSRPQWFCNLVYRETFEIVPVQLYYNVLQVPLRLGEAVCLTVLESVSLFVNYHTAYLDLHPHILSSWRSLGHSIIHLDSWWWSCNLFSYASYQMEAF